MTLFLAITPYTPLCGSRTRPGEKRVEKPAPIFSLNGEWQPSEKLKAHAAEKIQSDAVSRLETSQPVPLWDCVGPEARFAAQVIAQSIKSHSDARNILHYKKATRTSGQLLDRSL